MDQIHSEKRLVCQMNGDNNRTKELRKLVTESAQSTLAWVFFLKVIGLSFSWCPNQRALWLYFSPPQTLETLKGLLSFILVFFKLCVLWSCYSLTCSINWVLISIPASQLSIQQTHTFLIIPTSLGLRLTLLTSFLFHPSPSLCHSHLHVLHSSSSIA